jgi:hypothetical protein
MKPPRLPRKQPSVEVPVRLDEVRIQLLVEPAERRRLQSLLQAHHYLGSLKPVGECLLYAAVDASGRWLAVLVFSAAAKHLKARDQWIGWTRSQRDRRLSLVANNSRFLILPEAHQPNLGSRVLRLTLARLPADWQARYGHPVLVVETFVDPEQFRGTVYTAQGWQELGLTDGFGRHRRDFYVAHDKPKRLFARELVRQARRSLQAERLKPALAPIETKAGARCYSKAAELRTLAGYFADLPDYRTRTESYPPKALATLMLVALLCDAPRGQKDLVKLARRLTQKQRGALGVRPSADGYFPAPSQSTFSRFLAGIDTRALQERLLQIQTRVRGQPPAQELIVVDGKQPRHGTGETILGAVTVPGQFLLGATHVDTKTNEVPVARELFGTLALGGRTVSLDALHTCAQTARELVLEHGAHYLLSVKGNQPGLRQNLDSAVPAPPAGFSPSTPEPHRGADERAEPGGE